MRLIAQMQVSPPPSALHKNRSRSYSTFTVRTIGIVKSVGSMTAIEQRTNVGTWSSHDHHFEDGQSHWLTLAESLVLRVEVGYRVLSSTVAMAASGRDLSVTPKT